MLACIRSFQTSSPDHTLQHVIPEIGLQETPKPYKDDSKLINFFPEGKHMLLLSCHTHTHKLHPFFSLTITLINFFFHIANIKTNPLRASFSMLQHRTKDSAAAAVGRGSAFHFSFQDNEKWLRMSLSFGQPILFSAVHVFQPHGLTQSESNNSSNNDNKNNHNNNEYVICIIAMYGLS